ncbi:alcohol dehydrogenase [Penicillium malachiteum]|uniref:Alcohol dehydrogenase n=1 Tax=Penicillium malachiteum TaxID=1324776 RepID=A0AAD6MRW4_9EURO|nr:alcohol dehydrogenase [Penicillium malachiteum]
MMNYTLSVFRGSESGEITQDQISRSLSSNEVLLEITHASICGTDDIYLQSSQALGHEGVGIVRKKSAGVRSVSVGDRVGVCYIQKVCGKCDLCISGWNQYCQERKRYGADQPQQGCLGDQAIWSAGTLIPIPKSYSSSHAAACMCGGATAWTVLTKYNIQPGQRVGVIGVGGMGHLAVKLSAALGYETVVFSRSFSKREDCTEFGAKEFHILRKEGLSDDGSASSRKFQPVDHLLVCSSAPEDFSMLMKLVATHGTIYPLTVSLHSVSVPLLAMIDRGIRIQGSLTASTDSIAQMLEFCNENHVYPKIKALSMNREGIERAFQSMKDGQVRYKTILVKDACDSE